MSRTPEPSPPPDVIPVTEERVEIGRRIVETGHAVRVRKRVHDVPARLEETVALERVHVERVKVDRVVDAAPPVRQEGDVTIIPVVEERLVTRKELVLVEEIRITRAREERTAQASLTLRRDEVVIERFDPDSQSWLPDDGGPSTRS